MNRADQLVSDDVRSPMLLGTPYSSHITEAADRGGWIFDDKVTGLTGPAVMSSRFS